MAVARITLERRQFQTLVKRLKPYVRQDKDIRQLSAELKRSVDRRSLMAELTPREVVTLMEFTSDMPPVHEKLEAALEQAREVERLEREGAARIRANMDRLRGRAA